MEKNDIAKVIRRLTKMRYSRYPISDLEDYIAELKKKIAKAK